MGRQYNKVQKRRRRGAYVERQKAVHKAPPVSLRKKK